jgi:hypothetical protein
MKRISRQSGTSRAKASTAAGTLERQQRAAGEILDLDLLGDMGAKMRLVGLLAGGIDHQDQMIAGIGHHQIVQDPARLICEQGIARAAGGEPGDVGGDDPLQRRREAAAPGFAVRRSWPIWETSKSPAWLRVCRCSVMMPVGYWTGMS